MPTPFPSPSPRHPDDHFRPDIEGLRGVAVLLVVLFHAGIAIVPGGYVGVDVFFVISGFLITGLLLREHRRSGRVGLAAFYARRIRRLAPAACLVLAAMLPLAFVVLDPLSRGEALLDGTAAALSVSNVRFAAGATDYFAQAASPSPFLHFWSLSVEEQFYLAWPAMLLLALRFPFGRIVAGLLIGAVLVGSFAASLAVTETAPGAAFYLLPTRAWQLAAGGLLALLPAVVGRTGARRRAADLVGWLGLAGIVSAGLLFSDATAYPGIAAVLPTVGAVALIATGASASGPTRILGLGPLRFAGRISYALYLWHWPLLVLGAAAYGPLPLNGRLGLIGLAVILATISTLLVEEPIRRGLPGPSRRTLSAGLTAILVIAIGGTSLSVVSAAELDRLGAVPAGPAPTDAWFVDEPDEGPVAVVEPTDPPSSPAPGPTAVPSATPQATVSPVPATPRPTPKPTSRPKSAVIAANPRGPSEPSTAFRPALAAIRGDEERLKADRCIAYEPETKPRDCRYGKGSFTVALVGDSHASHWFPAVHAVASKRGWSVVPMIKVSCPFLDMPVHSNALKREYRECAAFNDSVVTRLGRLKPDLTIVAINHWVLPENEADGKVAKVGAALGRQVDQVAGRVVVLADSPHSGGDVPTCLAENAAHPDRCTTPYWKAFSGHAEIEKVGARAAGVPLIDLGPAICSEDLCADVVDGIVVYRDYHHLTATFSRSLGPALDRALRSVLGS